MKAPLFGVDGVAEMKDYKWIRLVAGLTALSILAACGAQPGSSGDNPQQRDSFLGRSDDDPTSTTIWEAFAANRAAENTVQVNKYLWSASLEVLDFLPVQTIDPFTGVIVTGFGTPPGSSRAYRATILIDDPALDARALNVALQTRGGPADASTVRAVEDAILSRARQLRIADDRL